jgi:hypothetical protein
MTTSVSPMGMPICLSPNHIEFTLLVAEFALLVAEFALLVAEFARIRVSAPA